MSRSIVADSRSPQARGRRSLSIGGAPPVTADHSLNHGAHAQFGHRFSQTAIADQSTPCETDAGIQLKSEGGQASHPNVPTAMGGGSALPGPVRGKMERAFGHSFSDVRIHSGSEAKQVGALAYTRGTDIHFQPGLYDPASLGGQELLGHELTHVVQQKAGRVSSPQSKADGAAPINADAGLEAEADALGARAARGERASVSGSGTGLQRKVDVVQCKPEFLNRLFGAHPAAEPEDRMTDETLLPEYSKDAADQGNINSVDLVTYSQNIGSYQTGYFKGEQQEGDLGMAAKAVGVRDDDLRTANRAVASSKVDDLLGLNAVAKTRHAEHNGKVGSVSEQAPGRQVRSLKDKPVTAGMAKTLDDNPFLLDDSGGDVKYARDNNGGYVEKDAVSRHNYFDYARPETQKGFNNLQWEDALTGQMDRHGGNIFVDDLTGKVTGIDNDAAFGGDRIARNPANLAKYGPDGESAFRPGKEGHNLGLPQMIDAETAQRFKDLKSGDLKKQLGGELSKEEVEATLQRLKHIQSHIKGLEKGGMVVGAKDKKGNPIGQYPAWDQSTLEAEKQNAKFSYLGHAATNYDSASDPSSGREAEAPHEVDAAKAASMSELNRAPRLQTAAPIAPPVVAPEPDAAPARPDPAMALLMQSRMNDSVFAPNSSPFPEPDAAIQQLVSSRMNDPVYAPNSTLAIPEEAPGRSRALSGAYGVPIPAPSFSDAPALGEPSAPVGRPRALSGPYGVPVPAPTLAEPPALGGAVSAPQAGQGRIADRLRFFEEMALGKK